ncbi:MAG: transaldolase [Burkholderiales bacterium]|nr:transaldolase [Burkholderiales bacterium]
MIDTNPLLRLHALGQRIWLDNLSRTLLQEGTLKKLVAEDRIAGVTSNPTIFFKAISESPHYREELQKLKADAALSSEQRYETLAVADIRAACDILLPLHRSSKGEDGYVSLEVSPALAHDAEGTLAAGLRLKAAVARDNLLVKVPATAAGLKAIEELIAEGCSINVTLMFSLRHVRDVAQAYVRGIGRHVEAGGDAGKVKSVASLFLSRVDTLVDKKLDTLGGDALALRGKSAIALAKLAYLEYGKIFKSGAFEALERRGARAQYLLWASTGTKNSVYSDVLYVEPLIGPETINTLPDATLAAFRDHGRAQPTLVEGMQEARQQFDALERFGIDMREVGAGLQTEGVALFEQSFTQLLALMEPVAEAVRD